MKKNYWNSNGLYQREYDEIYEKHVPSSSFTGEKHIDALIAASNMYYDMYNNGFANFKLVHNNFIRYVTPLCENIEEILENKNSYNITMKNRIELVSYNEAVYVWDNDEECETDEVDYHETCCEEVVIDSTEDDYDAFEDILNAIIKIAYDNCNK